MRVARAARTTAGCAVPGTWSPQPGPQGAAGLRRHRHPPENTAVVIIGGVSSPRKASLSRGVRGGSGAAGVWLPGAGERGIRARARGVRGNLTGHRAARNERSPEHGEAHCPYPGMCGSKAPVRERGDGGGTPGSSAVRRRDRREVPEPPRRQPPPRVRAAKNACRLAPRLPRGSRWGRRREGRGQGSAGQPAILRATPRRTAGRSPTV